MRLALLTNEDNLIPLNQQALHEHRSLVTCMSRYHLLRFLNEVCHDALLLQVDRKDAIVQMLDRDLEEAEEQYGLAVRVCYCNLHGFPDMSTRLLGQGRQMPSISRVMGVTQLHDQCFTQSLCA